MLRLVLALALAATCFAQTRPVIPETYSSTGSFEYLGDGAVAFGTFIVDRNQLKGIAVENSTYLVGENLSRFEILELYPEKIRYSLRDNGKGNIHCAVDKLKGTLPKYWDWTSIATYDGNVTYRHIVYDQWRYYLAGVEFILLVHATKPNVPVYLRHTDGPFVLGYEFVTFSTSDPPSSDFKVPDECSTTERRWNDLPFQKPW